MSPKPFTQNINSVDTEEIENALASACGGNLQVTHRLELRRLAISLWYEAEIKKQETSYQHDIKPLSALTNFKANLQRRKKASDSLTSSRLMDLPEPARTILLSDIAYTFRDEIDDYTQIDFGNAKQVPSPRGGQWNASTINGNLKRRNGILNNELYIGRIIYNRQMFVKDPDTGRRRSKPNPESLWVITQVPELQIIDQDTWERAQTLKKRFSSHQGNKRQTKKRLLSGLIKCGSCWGSMTIVNRERYSCSAKREKGTCDNPAGIQAQALENRVLDGLKQILLGREDFLDAFAIAFSDETARIRRERYRTAQTKQSELAKIQRSINRCLDFITDGDGKMDAVRDKLVELENSKERVLHSIQQEPPSLKVEPHPNIGQLYRRRVEQLTKFIFDENTREEAASIIRSLIDRIEITPSQKRGHPCVELVGGLAAILELAVSEQKKPPSERIAVFVGSCWLRG